VKKEEPVIPTGRNRPQMTADEVSPSCAFVDCEPPMTYMALITAREGFRRGTTEGAHQIDL
jgi:hypothetical protein